MKYQVASKLVVCVLVLVALPVANADWGWISLGTLPGEIAGCVARDQTLLAAVNYSDAGQQHCDIYKSTDRGANWHAAHTLADSRAQAIDMNEDGIYLAVLDNTVTEGPGKLIRSPDLGETWIPCSDFPEVVSPSCLALCADGRVWVGCNHESLTSRIYTTQDLGNTWDEISGTVNSLEIILAMYKMEPGHVLVGGAENLPNGGIYETSDFGATWQQNTFAPGLSVSMIGIFCGMPSSRYLACEFDSAEILYRQVSGSEWESLVSIPQAIRINGIYRSSQGILYSGLTLSAGEDSPIQKSVDAGDTWQEMFFDTVGQDEINHFTESNDGYLYAMGRNGMFRSAEPVIPPTPTPTTGPGTPTNTPHPPTHTPTPRPPTNTPTPSPPEPTPSPTSPCAKLGVQLDHPSDYIVAGDEFYLNAMMCNNLNHGLSAVPVFVILDIDGGYWFYPEWEQAANYVLLDIPLGTTELIVIEQFSWPANAGSFSGAKFWGAMTNPGITDVVGDLAFWEFSWGE